MTRALFNAIDLSQLPAPQVVEELSFEEILAARKAKLLELNPEAEPYLQYESDPLVKDLEQGAYREMLVRQRINDAAKAVMPAFAEKSDLDHIASRYRLTRLVLDPGDPTATPPIDPVYESDTRLRYRIQLAREGYSTAGPDGAYLFHALSADGRVQDVSVTSPAPVELVVTVLSNEGDGVPSADVLAAVDNALNVETVRPLTDLVTVAPAEIITYSLDVTLYFYPSTAVQPAMDAAEKRLQAYTKPERPLGKDVTLYGLGAAATVPGVQDVALSLTENLVIEKHQAAVCTGINLINGGYRE